MNDTNNSNELEDNTFGAWRDKQEANAKEMEKAFIPDHATYSNAYKRTPEYAEKLSQTEANKLMSKALRCNVTNFHHHYDDIPSKGFWFIVSDEIDAYRAAYYYQNRRANITKQGCGGWLVSIGEAQA